MSQQQRYTQKVDFAALKSELQLHEKNDLTLMKAENDRLMADVEKLKQRLREEVTRTQAGVRLDLNLEKGRIRDESSQQELKIKEVDTRIESEIAGLRTQIEQAKFSILQYLVGVATGSGALLLAYMRMMVSIESLARIRSDANAVRDEWLSNLQHSASVNDMFWITRSDYLISTREQLDQLLPIVVPRLCRRNRHLSPIVPYISNAPGNIEPLWPCRSAMLKRNVTPNM